MQSARDVGHNLLSLAPPTPTPTTPPATATPSTPLQGWAWSSRFKNVPTATATTPSGVKKAVPYFYAIGTADPGTGSKDGYFFTMSELASVAHSKCMHGIQVWLEHGDASREIIGDVVYSWLDQQNGLMVVLRFDSSTLRSKVVLEWVKNGLFSGISLGYNADVKYIDGLLVVHKKTIVELSIVRDPFHKSCKIGFVGNTLRQETLCARPASKPPENADAWHLLWGV